ncbi:hypothetical protein BS47DRAFT_878145 [Hydnum rufescens UP504]|uniref:Uncharacterized protein n=1 Tax=Hydnum rufescens UP504 TaxID=1448309 RepID=A0A9P6AZ52_9AGAM|nr:hypothetical protein BS47DRAFT_878145 [Hydnum rufescens UP504]
MSVKTCADVYTHRAIISAVERRLGLRGLLKAYMDIWGYFRVLSSPRPARCESTSGWRRITIFHLQLSCPLILVLTGHSARSMIRINSLEIGEIFHPPWRKIWTRWVGGPYRYAQVQIG